jgi:hypothetical protein
LVTLKFPIIDARCLQEAIEACGMTAIRVENNTRIRIVEHNLEYVKTPIGYKITLNDNNMHLRKKLDVLYQEYQRIYKKKLQEIEDFNMATRKIKEIEKEKLKELEMLNKSLSDEEKNDNTKKIKKEIEELAKERIIQEQKLHISQQEKEQVINEKLQVIKNTTEVIEQKAQKQGFKIRNIKRGKKTQIVLVRIKR